MRPAVWRGALVALAVATVGVGAVPADAAEAPAAVGWWWAGRLSATLPVLFSPVAEIPDGGLYVAGGAGGPTGVSALRYELASEVTTFTLTLTIADATGSVAVDACPAKKVWEPAENGGWDRRPEPDCDAASVTGSLNQDETELTFSLSPLQAHDGVIDVVLVPGVDPATQNSATFEVAFDPPGAEALAAPEATEDDSAGSPSAPVGSPASPGIASAPTTRFPPSLAPPPVTSAPIGRPSDSEMATPVDGSRFQPNTVASGIGDAEVFAYPAVLALPLVLLCGASYLGWALTRPMTVTRRVSGVRS